MLVRIDPASARPLHEQISGELRAAIAAGAAGAQAGDRLPAARELADALGVNVHTVLRAYASLRDEGLIELRRRRGAVVLPGAPARERAAVARLAAELVEQARQRGVDPAELVEIVKEVAT